MPQPIRLPRVVYRFRPGRQRSSEFGSDRDAVDPVEDAVDAADGSLETATFDPLVGAL
jgi:hypothetical protein